MTGAELKAARRTRLRLTAEALAEALDVDPRTVGRWERGHTRIPRAIDIVVRAALRHAWIREELGIHAKAAHAKSPPASARRSPDDQKRMAPEGQAD